MTSKQLLPYVAWTLFVLYFSVMVAVVRNGW